MSGKKAALVGGGLVIAVAVIIGMVLSLGTNSGVTLEATQSATQSEADTRAESNDRPDSESSSSADADESGNAGTNGSGVADLQAMQECLTNLGINPEDFRGLDPENLDTSNMDIRFEDGEMYVTIEGQELNMTELLTCLPDDLSTIPGAEDLDLGGLNLEDLEDLNLEDLDLGDLNLEDLDLGDFDLEDLGLGDLDLGDLENLNPEDFGVDMGAVQECLDSGFMDTMNLEDMMEDPDGFLTGMPAACEELFEG